MEGVQVTSASGRVPAEKKKGIPGSTLKLIAVAAMLIDHIAAAILTRILLAGDYYEVMTSGDMTRISGWLSENGLLLYGTQFLRLVGRLGFPIFAFLIVEGFQRTRNVKKYALRLALFALLSEVPFDLAFSGSFYNPQYQNVYFTLLIGLLVLWAVDAIGKRELPNAVRWVGDAAVLFAGMQLANVLKTDYSGMGVLTIVLMYVFRKNKVHSMLAGCITLTVMSLTEATAFFTLIPVAKYNGERGLKMKYFFYAFYPVHLLLLWLVALAMGMGWISAI